MLFLDSRLLHMRYMSILCHRNFFHLPLGRDIIVNENQFYIFLNKDQINQSAPMVCNFSVLEAI